MWAPRPSEIYMGILTAEFKWKCHVDPAGAPEQQAQEHVSAEALHLILRIRPPANLNLLIYLLMKERNFEAR